MIDINSIDQGQVYMLYEVLKNLEHNLENKITETSEEVEKLESVKKQIGEIELWANQKMKSNLHWTKEEILLRWGHKPTLIIEFHPSSTSYKTFGKEVVGNIEFSPEELVDILTNLQNKIERAPGNLKFKKIPDLTDHEISTEDIFELAGRR